MLWPDDAREEIAEVARDRRSRRGQQAMIVAGKAALEASRNKDQQALLDAGDLLLAPCEGCHQQFNPAVINGQ